MSEDAPEGKRPRFMAVRHLKDVRLNLQVQITQLEALGELYEAQEEFARVAAALGRALEATIVVLKTLQEEA